MGSTRKAAVLGVIAAANACGITVGDNLEPWGKWAKVALVGRFAGEANDCGCASVEVAFADDDFGLIVGDAFDFVAPFARQVLRPFPQLLPPYS